MRVELSKTPNWLKITWSYHSADIEAEILRRLSTVQGILGDGRRWFAPVGELWTLTGLFPLAQYDYTAMVACDAQRLSTLAESDANGPMAEPIYRKPKKGTKKPYYKQEELGL